MAIVNNMFVPAADVLGRRADGREYLLVPAGKPMPIAQAISLGLMADPGPTIPYENKISQGPQETGVPITGGQVLDASKIDATASAQALAKEYKIDLATVQGSGVNGRITKYDVEAIIQGTAGDEEE